MKKRHTQIGKKNPAGAKSAAEKPDAVKGHDFSRAASGARSIKPLGPEGRPLQGAAESAPNVDVETSQLVRIEKPIYGGAFLARVAGKAVFVPLALPGEEARVRIVDGKRGYATAEVEEIVTAYPQRVLPACPHFGACGGCQYQHANYAAQLAWKKEILRETLERGGVYPPEDIAVIAAEPWAYRNRIRVAFDVNEDAGYRGRRSHAIVPIAECPIAAPLLVRAALAAGAILRESPATLRVSEISLFCDAAETALLASVTAAEGGKHGSGIRGTGKRSFDEFAQALAGRIPELKGVEFLAEGAKGQPPHSIAQWGAKSLVYRAAGFDYRVDQGAFFQVNRWLVDALVERVTAQTRGAPAPQRGLAWDLFAGVGLFARQLARSFARVIAVESASASITALAHNLRGTSASAVKATTLDFLRRERAGEPPGLIVLDPPRTGLGPETTALLAEIAASEIVYVSCDPATLARDLRVLVDSRNGPGYVIDQITLADLFPQTFHLETVVRLRR
jgi:23S rRNA (uracil1939-C5)-methyltransferase